jgi:hypothetical protein
MRLILLIFFSSVFLFKAPLYSMHRSSSPETFEDRINDMRSTINELENMVNDRALFSKDNLHELVNEHNRLNRETQNILTTKVNPLLTRIRKYPMVLRRAEWRSNFEEVMPCLMQISEHVQHNVRALQSHLKDDDCVIIKIRQAEHATVLVRLHALLSQMESTRKPVRRFNEHQSNDDNDTRTIHTQWHG